MSDILQLYQKIILEHQRNPRNFGRLDHPTHEADQDNPICGDQVHIDLDMPADKIQDVKFSGRGCVISIASASIMTEVIQQKDREEIEQLYATLKQLIDPKQSLEDVALGVHQKLRIFEGIRRFPSRMKCAALGWEALMKAIQTQQT